MQARRRQSRSAPRRRAALDAALACFSRKGVAAASIEEICAESGASVGSLYHQFGNKAGIAAALYLDSLASFQAHVGGRLKADSSAREGLRALIAGHIEWVEKNPERARFLQDMRRAEAMSGHEESIRQLNREFAGRVGGWAMPHIEAGRLRRLPIDLFMAQLLGPTHEYVRGRLAGRESTAPKRAIEHLVDAAWRALGAMETP